MKKIFQFFSTSVIFFIIAMFANPAQSSNITIFDENSDGKEFGWSGKAEDNETEPGMVGSQAWDLEAFVFANNLLSVIGGYDFVNGEGNGNTNNSGGSWRHGDIFIDIDNNAIYGDIHDDSLSGGIDVTNTFGYDYVIDLDFESFTYELIELSEGATTTTTSFFEANQGSNPWRYVEGGTTIASNVSFSYESGLTGIGYGLTGGLHNMISGLDLSFLSPGMEFWVHTTMECGNDNLMGQGTAPVPEPATMLLFGTGLIGLAGVARRRNKKKA